MGADDISFAAVKPRPITVEPPKSRIAIMAFESIEKARAAFNSSAYKEAKKAGDKYAKFRVYAVEGLQ
jgi:uncharacterized protein (DUF1330 family)